VKGTPEQYLQNWTTSRDEIQARTVQDLSCTARAWCVCVLCVWFGKRR